MDVLVMGGSVFLGRAVVAEALAAGHRVTVFNRGASGPTPPGAEQMTGDRTSRADLEQLAGKRFDLVVDTSGYVAADVAAGAAVLEPNVGHYAFVSSINAFPGWPEDADYAERGAHRGNPDATRDDLPADLPQHEAYGWLKVGCELAVERAFGPERTTVLRAGAIVGPDDSRVGRLPWWIDRAARGGEVLVPGAPEDTVALIDSRDLAQFALLRAPGLFETGGPTGRDTRADLMAACAAATGTAPQYTYVDDDWLGEQGVEYWTEVPLWVPKTVGPSVFSHHNEPAVAAGLRWRPLIETVAATWYWMRSLPRPWQPTEMTPGLAPPREVELLAAWHRR